MGRVKMIFKDSISESELECFAVMPTNEIFIYIKPNSLDLNTEAQCISLDKITAVRLVRELKKQIGFLDNRIVIGELKKQIKVLESEV